MQEGYGQEMSRLRVVYRLELTVAHLRAQLSLHSGGLSCLRDKDDATVSTEDHHLGPKAFRTVCVQTDRETFVRGEEEEEETGGGAPQPRGEPPKKLDLASISLSLQAGPREDASASPVTGNTHYCT